MSKKEIAEFLLPFSALGCFVVFNLIWQALELHFYGEVRPSIVDTIISIPIYFSFYLNIKHLIKENL